MTKSQRRWVHVKALTKDEKFEIGLRCDAYIADVLVPQFLREIRPTQWNYPVSLFGKWRGNKYSFIIKYRFGWEDTLNTEFDSAWARLDHDEECVTELRFHVMWHRHTGQWFPYRLSVTVDEALHIIATDPVVQPHI